MAHPSDQFLASQVRSHRNGGGYPARTRGLGAHSLAQSSVGTLAVETGRAGVGVDPDTARRRRESIAAEFERRDMERAAEEARREADVQRREADHERDRAEHSRHPDHGVSAAERLLATAAVGAAAAVASVGFDPADKAATITADCRSGQTLTRTQDAAVSGGPVVGLTREQMRVELNQHGGHTAAVPSVEASTTSPAELVGQSGAGASTRKQRPEPTATPSPEVGMN